MTRKQIAGFVGGLLLVSWAAQFLILRHTGGIDSPDALPLMLPVMFLPGIFGLAFTVVSKRVRRSVHWKPRGVGAMIVAVFLPIGLALSAIGALELSGLGGSDYFEFGRRSIEIRSGPWTLGIGEQSWVYFAANIAVTALIYAAITGLATIGEEFGWRGVLQNSLIGEFGFGRGVALLGFIWAIWHFPIILAGYNYPQTPLLGALLFTPLLLISASFVMAWLTLWNRSFWPAVFMHGTINSVYDSMITKVSLNVPSPYTMEVLETGLFALLAVPVYFLARTKMSPRNAERSSSQEDAGS